MLKFKIGESNCDKLLLETEIINNINFFKIIEDPYGSNRMRYQYPKVFSIEIKENGIEILKIKRNISQCCSNLFKNNGWNLPLTISFIPKNKKWEKKEEIENILPKDYGKVLISGEIRENYKYGIVVPTFGRLEYVKTCLVSLKNTVLDEVLLVIVDESLTKDINEDKLKTDEFIRLFEIENCSVIKIFKNTHGNMFNSLLIGLDLICSRCDFLMNLDSDTIHKINWVKLVNDVYNLNKNDKPLLVTGYNSNNHEVIETKENFLIKKSVGGCHLFFSREDYLEYFRHTLISNKWDTNIYLLTLKLGGQIISVNPSVIQHIGEISSVREGLNTDKSVDFST